MSADESESRDQQDDEEDLVRHPPHGQEPEDGKLMESPITGNTYRVTEWEDLGDGKFRAISKEVVDDD